MINLPTITVCCITTKDYGTSIAALHKTLEQIRPAKTLYFSDIQYTDQQIDWIPIKPFKSVEDYNHFVFKQMVDYVKTDHILVVQHDGHPINADAWTDEFLQYDYIGAPWTYTDGRNVGNGGFSLRSRKLHLILQKDEFEYTSPEDEKICRYYRQTLEKKYGIRFAPEELAHKFSFEMHKPWQPTFGFHNNFHARWKPPIVLKRTGALGDVVMMEPLIARLHDDGYQVVLDTNIEYLGLFIRQQYQVEHISECTLDLQNARQVNLDMAYEVTPKQLVLKSYYETCGITDGLMRNSRLKYEVSDDIRLFNKYVILHTDDTEMAHRNVHGVDWEDIANYIQVWLGYPVFRVGRGNGRGGQHLNCHNLQFLAYVMAGANYFIGLDSGMAQIAIATGRKSMIFFGSVNPHYRYAEMENITVMQKPCPVSKAGCYHDVISVKGQDCQAHGFNSVPCITWTTEEVKKHLKNFIV